MGLGGVGTVYRNQSASQLYEQALARGEGRIGADGQLVVETGKHTGRSPQDKFIVREPGSENHIDWENNKPIDAHVFDALLARVGEYLSGKDVFSLDCHVGADPRYRLPVRIITEFAWHSLFARDLFIDDADDAGETFVPEFTVIDAALFDADPVRDGVRSSTFVLVNFARKIILIGGTRYAGEIKKSVFTVMNYLMPLRETLSMHCSANVGGDGDVAIFFGLSGTGKTTLSSDPKRPLIGDDEHGWSSDGVFNFEGGCYAKMIKLSQSAEPEIWAASHRFGTVLENVVMDPQTRKLDLDSAALTENTRSAYPVAFLPNFVKSGMANAHPKTIIMLTADAFGVLPPIAKLTAEQAMYHFLSGYTAKVAGTERGVTEPTATFSTCFGAPFMVHRPTVYANLLGERIAKHEASCWLVNTGWTGGPYGVGSRMKIAYTRAMVNAAIVGALRHVAYEPEPFFGLHLPTTVPGVPSEVLNPRNAWTDTAAYDAQARKLTALFAENFARFAPHASPELLAVAITA
ncbi:phosphoenolpyruvate carboxykinase [ATP] 2 [Vulcanimicrobium alpinum]|uniref:Phosphoenolpyruvate carboxykinase (ATP) n=1 Tax=Vulcanimicrobium alpinum TaxID=3016050 RepID=A0AAN1XWC3_UNVUL|nr:phosphoenolpyruvate carboxykinase (ATP) [Vulcanimicrobium alpinum]BDE06618.1 phosphoenolpyruvate carboxykinase [ATP] 2 [Vulcanimicrobium alpinum]